MNVDYGASNSDETVLSEQISIDREHGKLKVSRAIEVPDFPYAEFVITLEQNDGSALRFGLDHETFFLLAEAFDYWEGRD